MLKGGQNKTDLDVLNKTESDIVKHLLGGDDQKKENDRLLKIIEEQAAEIEALANENEQLKKSLNFLCLEGREKRLGRKKRRMNS